MHSPQNDLIKATAIWPSLPLQASPLVLACKVSPGYLWFPEQAVSFLLLFPVCSAQLSFPFIASSDSHWEIHESNLHIKGLKMSYRKGTDLTSIHVFIYIFLQQLFLHTILPHCTSTRGEKEGPYRADSSPPWDLQDHWGHMSTAQTLLQRPIF